MAAAAPRPRIAKADAPAAPKLTVGWLVELILPLLLVTLLIVLCLQLLAPFVGLLIWTIILAVCFYPLHARLKKRMSNRLSASLIGIGLAAVVLVPTAIAAVSAASSIPKIVATIQSGERQLPPPPARLQQLPLVGERAHGLWTQASTDMPAFTREYRPQLAAFAKGLVGFAGGLFLTVLLVVAAVILAAVTLAYSEQAREFLTKMLTRVTGSRASGEHYVDVIGATIRSVANGVVGVAFVQAVMCGIAFFALGIPGAGLLSLIAWFLAIVQIPGIIFVAPGIIYAFAAHSTTVAIIATLWLLFAGTSDTWLKPLMIGRGLEVPMPVILLGVIGGVIAYGIIGLFIGAVLLAVGYVLFIEWLNKPPVGTTAA
jgi:predicted PurR-regulated permease PerM